MKNAYLLFALILLAPFFSFAQESPNSRLLAPQGSLQSGSFAISMLHLRPLEDLALNGYQNGLGLNMEWMSNDLGKQLPVNVQLGARFDITGHGRYKAEVSLLEPVDAQAKYRLSNSQVGIGAVARMITRDAGLRLYVDFMTGFQSFSTTESYDLIGAFPGYEDYTSDAVLSKWNFNYGGGAGFQLRISQDVSLDMRAVYTRGSAVKYANLGQLTQVENQISYPTAFTPTSQWGIQAGLNFKIYDEVGESAPDCNCCCDCNHK